MPKPSFWSKRYFPQYLSHRRFGQSASCRLFSRVWIARGGHSKPNMRSRLKGERERGGSSCVPESGAFTIGSSSSVSGKLSQQRVGPTVRLNSFCVSILRVDFGGANNVQQRMKHKSLPKKDMLILNIKDQKYTQIIQQPKESPPRQVRLEQELCFPVFWLGLARCPRDFSSRNSISCQQRFDAGRLTGLKRPKTRRMLGQQEIIEHNAV